MADQIHSTKFQDKTERNVFLMVFMLAILVAIPGAQNVEQLRENLNVLEVTLTSDEMAAISALARGTRIVDPPHGPVWDSA